MLAILTDIHANREAFEACMEHADRHGATSYAFLGDFVGYGPDPAWIVDAIQKRVSAGAIALLGNHDQAILTPIKDTMHPLAQAVVKWTQAQLTPEQTNFLRALPYTCTLDDILFTHANAWHPAGWEYIDGILEAMRSLNATRCNVTFCGHMHIPMLYHMGSNHRVASFSPPPGMTIPLAAQRQWLCIPGAVGQPRDGNPAACYALYDPTTRVLITQRVPYDHLQTIDKIRAAALPDFLAQRLAAGI